MDGNLGTYGSKYKNQLGFCILPCAAIASLYCSFILFYQPINPKANDKYDVVYI